MKPLVLRQGVVVSGANISPINSYLTIVLPNCLAKCDLPRQKEKGKEIFTI
jgi:hypothetical protein